MTEQDTSTDTLESRREQAFPRLETEEIDRLRRFGSERDFADGERLFTAGEPGPGMFIVLSGRVRVSRPDGLGRDIPVVEQGEGQFLAEVGQLSGQPAFVDGHAMGQVRTLLLSPEGLRQALVAEAELGERIMRALVLRRVSLIEQGAGVIIIGEEDDAETARLLGFLTRNGQPHRLLAPGDRDAAAIMAGHSGQERGLPLAVCFNGQVLERPTEAELADCIGMTTPESLDGRSFDVAIVGAGPAGLAAAVYAASEGLSVIAFDARAFGGQAGASARIENYLGFPTGISGQALAGRAYTQALKFGVEMAIPSVVKKLDVPAAGNERCKLVLEDGTSVEARAVVLSCGARYRRLDIEGIERFEGRGIWYWASPVEARMARGHEVLLIGGGNSAGQAAVFLAEHAKRVRVLARDKLSDLMSRYLIDRIAAAENIEVIEGAEVTGLEGGEALARVRWREPSGEKDEAISHLFLFIGAEPATEWLDGSGVALERGFVATGSACPQDGTRARPPGPLETSLPGVFAIGDVRAGSTKRIGAAIGEGAAVVAQIHAHLAAQKDHAH